MIQRLFVQSFLVRYRHFVQTFRLYRDISYSLFDQIQTSQIQAFRINDSIRQRHFVQILFDIDFSIRQRHPVQTFRLDIDFSIRQRLLCNGLYDEIETFRIDVSIRYKHLDKIEAFRIDFSIRQRHFVQTFRLDINFSIRYRLFVQTFQLDRDISYRRFDRYRLFDQIETFVQTYLLGMNFSIIYTFRLARDISYRRFDQIQTFRIRLSDEFL